MTKPHIRTARGQWVMSRGRYAGFRIKRVGFGANTIFPSGTPLAFDALPKGWRQVTAVEEYWLGNYRHNTRDERVTLGEVLARVPAAYRVHVIAAHQYRASYDAARIARQMAALQRLAEELAAIR